MPKRYETPDPQIVRYEDGTHYVRIGDRERSLKTKDFAEACKRKSKALGILDNTGEASSFLKCGDVFTDYLRFRKSAIEDKSRKASRQNKAERGRKTISESTFREIENIWNLNLKGYWESVRFSKIDTEKWLDFTDQSSRIDLANPRKVFRGFLKWSVGRKYMRYVPELPIPPVNRRERHVLKPAEINKIFEHAEGNVLLFVSMYLFMGMRRKEIMTLKWSDIHFDGGYLVLRKSEVKIRRGRPLPLNAFVQGLLIERKHAQGNKTDFVFPNRKSNQRHADVSGLKTAWKTIMKKCGWETGYITPHDLRATFEAYAHKATAFTDTQREKFAGASIDVQKKHYVRFDAEDVRGLEAVVQVPGLESILLSKLGIGRGEEKSGDLH